MSIIVFDMIILILYRPYRVTLEDDEPCYVYILVALILIGYFVNMVVLIVRSFED
jgi:hypothetical protein